MRNVVGILNFRFFLFYFIRRGERLAIAILQSQQEFFLFRLQAQEN